MSPRAGALRNIPTITTLLIKALKLVTLPGLCVTQGRHAKHQLQQVFLLPHRITAGRGMLIWFQKRCYGVSRALPQMLQRWGRGRAGCGVPQAGGAPGRQQVAREAEAERRSTRQLAIEGCCQRDGEAARMLQGAMVMSCRGNSVKHRFTRSNVWIPESNHGVNSPYLHNLTYAHSGA